MFYRSGMSNSTAAVPILETPRLRLRGSPRSHRFRRLLPPCGPTQAWVRYTIGAPSTPQRSWQRLMIYRGLWSASRIWVLGGRGEVVASASSANSGFADFKRTIPALHRRHTGTRVGTRVLDLRTERATRPKHFGAVVEAGRMLISNSTERYASSIPRTPRRCALPRRSAIANSPEPRTPFRPKSCSSGDVRSSLDYFGLAWARCSSAHRLSVTAPE